MAAFEDIDPDKDEIFISGLHPDVTEADLVDFFGTIGVIKDVRRNCTVTDLTGG